MKAIVAIIALALLVLFFLYLAVANYRRYRRFFTWLPMTVTFVEKTVKPHRSMRMREGRSFIPAIKYRYQVDGKTYSGSELHDGGPVALSGSGARESAEGVLASLRDGMAGRYNPQNPREAALLPLPRWGFIAPLLGTLSFLIFLLFAILRFLAE